MVGRTHDLVAFTALMVVFVYSIVPQMTLATLVVAIGANMIGGLAPDLDTPTADIWDKIRGGNLFSRFISPALGGHRNISHSILGVIVANYIVNWILSAASSALLVDMAIVWWAFMIGFISHLLADMVTREGIPLFFPWQFSVGFPPIKALRIKSGSWFENLIVFPGLLVLNAYLFFSHYGRFIEFLRGTLR